MTGLLGQGETMGGRIRFGRRREREEKREREGERGCTIKESYDKKEDGGKRNVPPTQR